LDRVIKVVVDRYARLFVGIFVYTLVCSLVTSTIWLLVAALTLSFYCIFLLVPSNDSNKQIKISQCLLPALLGLMLIVVTLLDDYREAFEVGRITIYDMINGLFVLFVAWSYWHFMMQKYGILRPYNVNSGNSVKVPGYVDRLFVFAWFPLIAFWLAPMYEQQLVIELGVPIIQDPTRYSSVQCASIGDVVSLCRHPLDFLGMAGKSIHKFTTPWVCVWFRFVGHVIFSGYHDFCRFPDHSSRSNEILFGGFI